MVEKGRKNTLKKEERQIEIAKQTRKTNTKHLLLLLLLLISTELDDSIISCDKNLYI